MINHSSDFLELYTTTTQFIHHRTPTGGIDQLTDDLLNDAYGEI